MCQRLVEFAVDEACRGFVGVNFCRPHAIATLGSIEKLDNEISNVGSLLGNLVQLFEGYMQHCIGRCASSSQSVAC